MKLAKSLLLGSAAGLFAVAGAQAADLPVRKAAPAAVDYVRICSPYGVGFFFIPGTETCLRVSGSVRFDLNVFELHNRLGPVNRRTQDQWQSGGRSQVNLDARTQTDFGLLRAYIRTEYLHTAGATGANDLRVVNGFIQWGGLTVGRISESAFEFYSEATTFSFARSTPSTYYNGANAIWYTANFGGGFEATIALEDNPVRKRFLTQGGNRIPEIIGRLRINQGWGSAHLAVAAHHIYSNVAAIGDRFGWAATAGVNVRLPMLGSGTQMWLQGAYADGAISYVGVNGLSTRRISNTGIQNAYAVGTSIRTTKAWAISAGLRHAWTPQWETNLHAAFGRVTLPAAIQAAAPTVTNSVNNGFSYWTVNGNVVYRPVAGFLIAGEVGYLQQTGKVRNVRFGGGTVKTDSIWQARLRVQRDF